MSALTVVRAHLAAEDAQDVAATMATFTDACWYAIPGQDLRIEGRDAIRAHYERLFSSFPDLLNEQVALYEAGSRVFAQLEVRRRHLGHWGPFAPTGRTVVTHALAEFIVAPDGLLEAEVVHVNPLEALVQIGAVPTANALELAAAHARLCAAQDTS